MHKEAFDLLLSLIATKTSFEAAGPNPRSDMRKRPTQSPRLPSDIPADFIRPGNAQYYPGNSEYDERYGSSAPLASPRELVAQQPWPSVAGTGWRSTPIAGSAARSHGKQRPLPPMEAAGDVPGSAIGGYLRSQASNQPLTQGVQQPLASASPPGPNPRSDAARPAAPGPIQGPGMRGAVTSFDQLPPEFQARFRERLAAGSVRGANEQDAVASYNQHYAGTTGQLRALSKNPQTAYGALGRADRGLSSSANIARLQNQA